MIGAGIAKLKLSSRERKGLVIAAVCSLLTLTDKLIVRRLAANLDRIGRRLEVEKRQLAGNLRILDSNRKAVIRREYRQYGNRIRKQLTSAEESAALLAQVETLARSANVRLVATRPRDMMSEGFYETYAVTVEIEARLEKIVDFLYRLESSPKLLRIDEVSLSPKNKEPDSPLRGMLLITQVLTL